MIEGAATVLGGLRVWVQITYWKGDGYTTDDDYDVDAVYWLKRNGTAGAPFSKKMYDRLDKYDPYWVADVGEQVFEQLAYEENTTC